MIDRYFLNTLRETNRLLQQNRHTIQTIEDQYQLIRTMDAPRVDPAVIQTVENWSQLNLSRANIPNTHEIRDLLHYTHELSALHTQFTNSVSVAPHSFPPTLFQQSVIEVFLHIRSIEGLFPNHTPEIPREANAEEEQKQQTIEQITEETKSEIEQWLYQVHPSLCTMWQGARQTLVSDNPDRTRQVMVSLRTLLDHVTRKLAPDAKIRAWSTDPQYYQENGKTPKGKGRIFYICRHIHSGDDSFAKFLDADVNAIVSLWITLNRLHELEQTISDVQLRIVVERFESALLLLVRASEVQEE